MESEFKYKAFISYSHADEEWAKWLHSALETYRVPKRLVGRESEFGPVPARISPVFRDRDELATATNLGETLTRALQQSAFQIVICSRKAARSRWVNEEILTFKRLGRENRIFALVVDGEPGASANPATAELECFPPALIYRMGPDGEPTAERGEPIAADVRPGKDGKLDVKLKLVAGMLGVGLDELKQRDAHRRHVRMMWLVSASVVGMAITSALAAAAWLARNEAERQRARAEAEAETARQTTRFMVDLFKVSDPGEALGNTITAREILDKGAARIERELADQPAIQATLMDTMGTVYTSLGLYEPAVNLVRQAFEKRRGIWGPEHPEVASSQTHLGEILRLKSDFEEAERQLRGALETRRRIFGDVSAEVADTLSRLVELLSDKGEYAAAEPLVREALSIRRQLYGNTHPDIAKSIEDLGTNYYQRGEYEQAVEYLREALAMQRELHKTPHPALIQALGNLGWAYMGLSKFEEAEPLCRLALAMARQVYGDVHPETAAILNNLAFVLQVRGDLQEADAAFRETLVINRKLLGESHPTIALTLSNIGFVAIALGNQDEGVDLLRQSLDMTRRVNGPEHPDVGARAATLAYWLVEMGKLEEAEPLVEEALSVRRAALGAEHPAYANTLTVKANLRLGQRRFGEARDLAVEGQRLLLISLPEDSWQVAAAKNTEGAARAAMGDYAAAERLLLDSQAGLAESPIPHMQESGRSRLADLYLAWGKPGEAYKYRRPK